MQPCEQSELGCETMLPPFNPQPVQTIKGQNTEDRLGQAASISNNWIAVGALGADLLTGLVKVYRSSAAA